MIEQISDINRVPIANLYLRLPVYVFSICVNMPIYLRNIDKQGTLAGNGGGLRLVAAE